MSKIVTLEIEVENEDVPDGRIAYMVFSALQSSGKIKSVEPAGSRPGRDPEEVAENRERARVERARRNAEEAERAAAARREEAP